MKRSNLVVLAVSVVIAYSIFSYASIYDQPTNIIKQENREPHKIIEIFYKAVDRGELIVFEQILDRTVLIPLRVEYVYELNGSKPTVKVYSEIKKPMPVGDHEGILLRGISAVIDSGGHIIEIRAHVFQ